MATRTFLEYGNYGNKTSDCGSVEVDFYRCPSANNSDFDHLVNKATNVMSNLVADDRLDYHEWTTWETDTDLYDANNNGDTGAYDALQIAQDNDWTSCDLTFWIHDVQKGGSATGNARTVFDSKLAAAQMSTNNTQRVVAHGGCMELLHAFIDGSLPAVEDLHNNTEEHHLGNCIYKYEAYYGAEGFYGTPIATGAESWNNGNCASNRDFKDGVTFEMTSCTRKSVGYTKSDRGC